MSGVEGKSAEAVIAEAVAEIARAAVGAAQAAEPPPAVLKQRLIVVLVLIAFDIALLAYYTQGLLEHPVISVFKTMILFTLGGAVIVDKGWLRDRARQLAGGRYAVLIATVSTLLLLIPLGPVPVAFRMNPGASIAVDGDRRIYEAKTHQVHWMHGLRPHTMDVEEHIRGRTLTSTVSLTRSDVLFGSLLTVAGIWPWASQQGYLIEPTVPAHIEKPQGKAAMQLEGDFPALMNRTTDAGQNRKVERLRSFEERVTIELDPEEVLEMFVPLGTYHVRLRTSTCDHDLGIRNVTRADSVRFEFTAVPCKKRTG